MARQVDRNGRVREFTYDPWGHVAGETWYNTVADADAGQNATETIGYLYDPAGRLLAEWDAASLETCSYDSLGRETSVTSFSAGSPVVVFLYGYRGDSPLPATVSVSIDGTPDYQDACQYDAAGRVLSIHRTGQADGNSVADVSADFTYTPSGQFQSITRALDGQTAVTASCGYDVSGNLTSLGYSQGPNSLAGYSYVYDAAGRIIEATTPDGTIHYTYDPTGQLTGASYNGGGLPDEAYAYDANGNRETANGSSYVTGAGNRLISDGTYTYSYDAEGNRTAKFIDGNADGVLDAGDTTVTVYGWDVRNRLTSVTTYATFGADPTQIVEYRYDPENRLVGETVDSNGDGVVDHQTYFVYDGRQIVAQFDKDGPGAVTGADLSHRYLWGPAVDQVLADEQVANVQTPGNVVWPLADNLGTVRDLAVSQDGITSVANHRVFDSYGNLVSQTNAAVDFLFGFTGRPESKATGLRNHLNRWTDPQTGDWMSEDPSGFTAGDANTRRYCGNSPTNRTDPTGLEGEGPGFWDWLQGMLDAGGVFEPTPFCDLTSGAISAIRGNWGDAGCSLAGCIPYIGDSGKVVKYGRKAKAVADAAKYAAKIERHHLLPVKFAEKFAKVGLKIEDYVIDMTRGAHRLKPGGLHTGQGVENWNGMWKAFFDKYPNATKKQILEQLAKMKKIFGLE